MSRFRQIGCGGKIDEASRHTQMYEKMTGTVKDKAQIFSFPLHGRHGLPAQSRREIGGRRIFNKPRQGNVNGFNRPSRQDRRQGAAHRFHFR